MSELMVIERQLTPLANRFEDVLGGVMDSRHLIQSVLVSLERSDKLQKCSPQSILNAAMTFANLRLPVDGATGQGFMLPFKGVAQPVIGYKGYNTIGARGAITITGGVVREGDEEWDYREGSGGFVHHKKRLDNPNKIIAAWAVAESRERPNAVAIMGIGELLEIKSRSPAIKFNASDTPWRDAKIGEPAMMEKTAKRRLSRVLPFEIDDGRFHKAARVDEAHDEQGLHSYIRGDGAVMVEGNPVVQPEANYTPSFETVTTPKPDAEIERQKGYGRDAAEGGMLVLQTWWSRLGGRLQVALKSYTDEVLKPMAVAADKEGGA